MKQIIIIPSGSPPILLPKGDAGIPSDAQILAWGEACREGSRDHLSSEALRYWVRYTFDSYTPEYRAVGERISVLFSGVL